MRKLFVVCLLIVIEALLVVAIAQVDTKQEQDSTTRTKSESFLRKRRENAVLESLPILDADTSQVDTYPLVGDFQPLQVDSIIRHSAEFKPDPNKAVLYGLVPGMGQIYNRQYWKLPIIYGGFIGLTYAISWNGGMYQDYSQAYKDLALGTGDSWKNLVSNPNITQEDAKTLYESRFKRQKDYFRRNRDLAIIGSVALYALCIIDAYVDAQLYDFDVSPDLSMRIEPVMYEPTLHTRRSFGLKCSVSF